VGQVVRRKRYRDAIAENHTNAVLAHATAELRAYDRTGVRLHFELPAGEDVGYDAVELYMIIATQSGLLGNAPVSLGRVVIKVSALPFNLSRRFLRP
jgi:hypothetical protein